MSEFDELRALADGMFQAAHPGCCSRCGWALSGHARSQYGLDCPWGVSPAKRAGHIGVLVNLSQMLDRLEAAEARVATGLREAADFIKDTSGVGLRNNDYARGWYAALEYALGELYDRADRAELHRNGHKSDAQPESGAR